MEVFIETYGCTLNQADSDILEGVLAERGVEVCSSPEKADVIILNTCFVKRQTQQKILDRLRKLKGRKLVVAGCMPSANRLMVERAAPNASLVGPYSISNIYDAVLSAYEERRSIFLDVKPEDKYSLPKIRRGVIIRIPVSEGCTSCCSFCVTRIARPMLHSYDENSIVKEVEKSVRAGFREIRITSMDAGAYGIDQKTDLTQLLEKIDGIDGKFLVRVGMINPQHVKRMLPSLIDSFRSEKVYKFLRMPLQSGDDDVLRSMGRSYCVEDFIKIVEKFREEFPELTLATDLIAGFPTESDDAFKKTLDAVKEVEPDVVNNSKFFPRPGTKAAVMKQLPNKVVVERSRLSSSLCRSISLKRNRQFIGKELEVLLTEKTKNGVAGRTHSYKQVSIKGGRLGDFVNVEVYAATQCCLKAMV